MCLRPRDSRRSILRVDERLLDGATSVESSLLQTTLDGPNGRRWGRGSRYKGRYDGGRATRVVAGGTDNIAIDETTGDTRSPGLFLDDDASTDSETVEGMRYGGLGDIELSRELVEGATLLMTFSDAIELLLSEIAPATRLTHTEQQFL